MKRIQRHMTKGINVLSLCDGISCAHIALDRAGIQVDNYFAAEIKDIAIKVTQDNYPDTIQIGDVNKVTYKDGVLSNGVDSWCVDFDLVCFGSPCQSFSIAMNTKGRVGLEDKIRSGLYFECKRVLDEVKPKYFFVENVGSMKEADVEFLSTSLGVQPIRINSKLVAPAMRDRYYWTNIEYTPLEKKDICLQDILEDGYTQREKARALMRSGGGIHGYQDYIKLYRRVEEKGFGNLIYSSKEAYEQCKNVYDTYFKKKKIKELEEIEEEHPEFQPIFRNNIRYLSQREQERCQTLPERYTKSLEWLDAQDVIGDGWTVDVIVAFFQNIK